VKELFENDHGRKVITYLVAPRDTKFFIKDYVKRLEKGDNTETSKKDPEKRRQELVDHIKPYLKAFLNKEIASLLFNGAAGILVPSMLDKLGSDGDEIIQKIAIVLLKDIYVPSEDKDEKSEGEEKPKVHPIEDATVHYVIKKILEKESNSLSECFFFLNNVFLFNLIF
jgi:hypothetical protein